MFRVTTNSPMDDRWQERDKEIETAAGRISDFSGAGVGRNASAGRDHGWYVKTMKQAQEMKSKLSKVEGVKVTIRER